MTVRKLVHVAMTVALLGCGDLELLYEPVEFETCTSFPDEVGDQSPPQVPWVRGASYRVRMSVCGPELDVLRATVRDVSTVGDSSIEDVEVLLRPDATATCGECDSPLSGVALMTSASGGATTLIVSTAGDDVRHEIDLGGSVPEPFASVASVMITPTPSAVPEGGSIIRLTVQVLDAEGDAVGGAPVVASAFPATATFDDPTVDTDSNGESILLLFVPPDVGAVRVRAAVGPMTDTILLQRP